MCVKDFPCPSLLDDPCCLLAHPSLPRESPVLSSFWTLQSCSESENESCSVMSDSLRPGGLYSPWNSPGQNTGAGSHSLLQGIFPTQGSNRGLPNCRQILYQPSPQGSPRHFHLGPTLVYGTFLVSNFCWALIDWAPINYTETLVLRVTLGGSGKNLPHPGK